MWRSHRNGRQIVMEIQSRPPFEHQMLFLLEVTCILRHWLLFNSVHVLWAIKGMKPRRAINMFYVHKGPFHYVILEQQYRPRALSSVHSSMFQWWTSPSLNVAVFCDTVPCSSYVNRRFEGTYHLHLQGWKSARNQCPAGGFRNVSYKSWSFQSECWCDGKWHRVVR
jgi:hypothetical protein